MLISSAGAARGTSSDRAGRQKLRPGHPCAAASELGVALSSMFELGPLAARTGGARPRPRRSGRAPLEHSETPSVAMRTPGWSARRTTVAGRAAPAPRKRPNSVNARAQFPARRPRSWRRRCRAASVSKCAAACAQLRSASAGALFVGHVAEVRERLRSSGVLPPAGVCQHALEAVLCHVRMPGAKLHRRAAGGWECRKPPAAGGWRSRPLRARSLPGHLGERPVHGATSSSVSSPARCAYRPRSCNRRRRARGDQAAAPQARRL
jgi:hypothetical protein